MGFKSRRKARRKYWISSAIKRPGALHKTLGVPAGKKIGVKRLRAAAKRSGVTGRRARLALTLGKLRR